MRTLVAYRRDGTPVAAIPTRAAGPAVVGARSVAGGYWPFRSVPVRLDSDVDELASLFAHPATGDALGGLFRLGPVPADEAGIVALAAGARQAGWSVLERPAGCGFVLAAGVWPGASTRRRLGSYARRLAAAAGPVRVEHVTGAGWSMATLALLAAVEGRSWVGRHTDRSGAKFATPAARRGWHAVLADPVLADALSATILSAGDMPLAYSFDLRDGDRHYAIATGYCERFAAFRPGRIVTMHALDRAAAAGVAVIDLGTGDSGYKREMGAVPGARLVEYLFVRHPVTAAIAATRWGDEGGAAIRRGMPWLAAGIATAGAVAMMVE